MNFTLFCKIFISILLFFLGLISGLSFEEFHHRAIQWIPSFKKKNSLEKSILADNPELLSQKLQKNSILSKSWKFPEILLVLQSHYIKNQDKLEETFVLGTKKLQPTIQYGFWKFQWAKKLYQEGYKIAAKKMLEEKHFSDFWIEPELLKQKGLWAYQEGEKKIAFRYWQVLEQKFAFSKAFREIKKEYCIVQNF